jgi:hypothetical protein
LSQAVAFAPAHLGEFSKSGLAGMMAPVQFICGLASETVPKVGLALRAVGMLTIATAATDKQSTAASAYLDRVNVVRVRAIVSVLNMSESPSLPIADCPDLS